MPAIAQIGAGVLRASPPPSSLRPPRRHRNRARTSHGLYYPLPGAMTHGVRRDSVEIQSRFRRDSVEIPSRPSSRPASSHSHSNLLGAGRTSCEGAG